MPDHSNDMHAAALEADRAGAKALALAGVAGERATALEAALQDAAGAARRAVALAATADQAALDLDRASSAAVQGTVLSRELVGNFADRADGALVLANEARSCATRLETALREASEAARESVALAKAADQAALDLDKANTEAAQATVLSGELSVKFERLALFAIAEHGKSGAT